MPPVLNDNLSFILPVSLKDLSRHTMLADDKGLQLPAITVFSAGIRYLKDHLLSLCEERRSRLEPNEIHWVVTVPAIWDDTAKQFMREAAVNVSFVRHLYV